MSSGHAHHNHSEDFKNIARPILWLAFALNFPLFIVEVWQGLNANSTSLLADSMDFLSDSFSYLLTLYVLAKPLRVRAYASLFKALLMLLLAAVATWQGVKNILQDAPPEYFTMGWVALLAASANITTALLLFKTRGNDSNMSSIWLCSRNDALNNIAIFIAAIFVYTTNSHWPDIVVALFIAYLSTTSAFQIIKQAKNELKQQDK